MKLLFSVAMAAICFCSSVAAFQVKIEANAVGGAKPVIAGKTNLPDQTPLLLTITRKESGYMAQDKVLVKGGGFKSSVFSQNGKPLNSGAYHAEIGTPMAALMPASVQAVVGKSGEKMQGASVKKGLGGQSVDYRFQFVVGGVASKKDDESAKEASRAQLEDWKKQSCSNQCKAANAAYRHDGKRFDLIQCFNSCMARLKGR